MEILNYNLEKLDKVSYSWGSIPIDVGLEYESRMNYVFLKTDIDFADLLIVF